MEQLEVSWVKSFNKSMIDNNQLVFSKKITVSTIDHDDYLPYSEILDIQEISNVRKFDNYSIMCFIDNRKPFYNLLRQNSIASISIFFPLTREKYNLKCGVFSISGNNNEPSESEKIKINQFEKYAIRNFKYNHTINKDDTKSEEYIESATTYINNLNSHFTEINKENILNQYWSKLDNEEKLNYETIDPDTLKAEEKKNDDLSKFEAQEEVLHNKNFTILYFIPLDIEHTIYPMPQVVANSRKPNFESLYKPSKKVKKYMFIFNFIKIVWNLRELNA